MNSRHEVSFTRRQLKKLDFDFSLYGTKFGIPLCCIIWFECVWNTLRADRDFNSSWYNRDFSGYDDSRLCSGNERIMCPECVVKELSN